MKQWNWRGNAVTALRSVALPKTGQKPVGTRRWGVLLLALLAVCALNTTTAKAAELEGNGTEESPYLIHSETELQAVNENLNAYYQLANDITITDIYWETIGDQSAQFQGDLNGDNFTISYNIPDEAHGLICLFFSSSGTIHDLNINYDQCNADPIVCYNNGTIRNCTAKGKASMGGLVDTNNGLVEDCRTECFVSDIYFTYASGGTPPPLYVGGLISTNESTGTVKNCSAACTVTGGANVATIGGLIGVNKGTVENCNSASTVMNEEYERVFTQYLNVGGLIGDNSGTVKNCSADCTVTGKVKSSGISTISIGGLIGYNAVIADNFSYSNMSFGGNVENCRAKGTITGTGLSAFSDNLVYVGTGGLIGYNDGYFIDPHGQQHETEVKNCSADCIVVCDLTSNGTKDHIGTGGLICILDRGSVTQCISKSRVETKANRNDSAGGLIGFNLEGVVTLSGAYAPVKASGASSCAGGFVGLNSGSISDCFAAGEVYTLEALGSGAGFAGAMSSQFNGNDITTAVSIKACYAIGRAYGFGTNKAFIGNVTGGALSACYYNSETAEATDSTQGVTALTTSAMKAASSYPLWDFVDNWEIDPGRNDGYPYPAVLKELIGGSDVPQPAFTIHLTAKNDSSETVTAIPKGAFWADVELTRHTKNGDASYILVAAYDKDGRYLQMFYANVKNLPIETPLSFAFHIDNSSGTIASLKAFAVTSLTSLVPQGQASSIE